MISITVASYIIRFSLHKVILRIIDCAKSALKKKSIPMRAQQWAKESRDN